MEVLLSKRLLYMVLHSVKRQPGDQLSMYMYVYQVKNVFLCCPTPRLHCFLSSHWPSLSSNEKNLTSSLNNFCKLYDQLFCKLHVIYNIPSVNFAYILKAISTKRNISLSWQPARNRNTSEYCSCPVPADLTPVLVNILLNKILQAEVYCVLNT
jgi:hypothetical protein